MKYPHLAIIRRHTEEGPRCGGGNLGSSPSEETQEGPGGGPSCVFWGLYSALEAGSTASASREAEGTGPVKPRQPAFAARCQTRPGASSGGCVERVRKERKCPPKRRPATVFSNASRLARQSSATAGWGPSSPPRFLAFARRRRRTCERRTPSSHSTSASSTRAPS